MLSRREFAALVTAAPFAFARPSAGAAAVTAQDVVDRIKKNLGVDWKAESVDAIKAGDASTAITGIATTSMATMAVLQQAIKAGANLVITAEPTFYSRGDARTPPAGRGGSPPLPDPVFAAKNEFIAKNQVVVFRLRDHWRLRTPDPLAQGLGTTLGWTKYQVSGNPARYDIPAMTLDALASHVKKALDARGGLRVVGDPQTKAQKIALLPGSTPITASLEALPGADVVIAGEVREWESADTRATSCSPARRKA